MDVDNPPRKLDFDAYVTDTPTKKRPHTTKPSEPTNIEVFLRIRPKDPQKISTAQYSVTNQNQSIRLTAPNKTDTRCYSFNHVFDSSTTNVDIYDRIGRKAIDRLLSGYTNLIFTYGITGSGKTHTITGNNMDGLLPSILHNLFNHNLMRNSNKYSIFVSYLENYTKELYDLLQDEDSHSNKENMNFRNNHIHNNNKRSNNPNKVTLRVLPDGADILDSMTIGINNAEEGIQLIQTGNERRSKAHTKLNRNSSRSHVLFILDLFEGDKLRSRLCLVDLAGSESAKRNGFSMNDIGFNEACQINKSLSVLGRCIESIQNKDNGMKAPWREMVLTKLLWRYLRGNGYVTMIVTAHIVNEEYNETMRALEFAATTQNVEMNPVVNSVRPSTRHKSRVCKTPKKTESKSSSINATPSKSREGSIEIKYINSCNIDQLRKIAVESYKTALRSRDMMRKLKKNKIDMIENMLKNGRLKGIQEETTDDIVNAMEIDDEECKWNEMKNKYENKEEEYQVLSRKMTQNMIDFEEKMAKYKYESQNIESKYKDNMENIKRSFEFKIVDLEEDLKNKEDKMKGLEAENNTLNERIQENESNINKELLIKLNESEQKIEKYAHLNREYKEKIQKQHINIGELKDEYKDELDETKRINDDAQKEILTLNRRLKENNKYKLEFEQLTQEFIQRGEELKNIKNMLNAQTKQSQNQKLVYEKKINSLDKDIIDQKMLFEDDIKQLKDTIHCIQLEHDNKVQNITKEWTKKYSQQTNITAQKQEIIEELNHKFNEITAKMNENNNWSQKYQKLFATFNHHTNQAKVLNTKYQHQSNQLSIFKQAINELKQSKNNMITQIKTMQNEVERGLKHTFSKLIDKQSQIMSNKCIQIENLQRKQQSNEQRNYQLIQQKDKEIQGWHTKFGENEAIYNEIKQQYHILENKYNEAMQTQLRLQNVLQQKEHEIQQIQNELDELHKDMTKQKEFHRLALQEADQEYLKEQQESKELYELNVKFEHKNTELKQQYNRLNEEMTRLRENESTLIIHHQNEVKHLEQRLSKQIHGQFEEQYQLQLTEQTDSLQKQLKTLQDRLKHLQLQSTSSSRRESHESGITISDIADGNRANRKRSREQMESDDEEEEKVHSNPNKKRKITMNGDTVSIPIHQKMDQDDEGDHHDINKSDSSSLQPQNLLNKYEVQKEDNNDDEEEDDVEIESDDNAPQTPESALKHVKAESRPRINRTYSDLVSPALSHLSEGDAPLPKVPKSRVLKSIQRNIKARITYNKSTPNTINKKTKTKYLARRTPATKEPRRRLTTQTFDINQATPTTKTALKKLRCVDLKQKLKKHNLKTYGKKDDLVQTLFDHKNAIKEDEDEESDCSDIDSEWIGKCIKQIDDKKYYGGIMINCVCYSLGDQVFVINSDGDDWLAQIVELYQDEDGCFMNNVWFWKHSDIAKAIKIKPYNSWKPSQNEVFLSCGHDADTNHISLINYDKEHFKVFDSKKEMEKYNCSDSCEIYFCEYVFDMARHKLMKNNKINKIEEEEEDDIEYKLKRPKRKGRASASKCESPKNKKHRGRNRRRRQKSTK